MTSRTCSCLMCSSSRGCVTLTRPAQAMLCCAGEKARKEEPPDRSSPEYQVDVSFYPVMKPPKNGRFHPSRSILCVTRAQTRGHHRCRTGPRCALGCPAGPVWADLCDGCSLERACATGGWRRSIIWRSAMAPIRLGIVGCGAISQVQHLPNLAELQQETGDRRISHRLRAGYSLYCDRAGYRGRYQRAQGAGYCLGKPVHQGAAPFL